MHPCLRLLFVDEGPDWLANLRDRLAKNYEVMAVETGPEALALLESMHIDVLITDNHLASVQDRRFSQTLKYQHSTLMRVILAKRPALERAISERNGFRVDGALPIPSEAQDLVQVVQGFFAESTMRVSKGAGRIQTASVQRRAATVRQALAEGDKPAHQPPERRFSHEEFLQAAPQLPCPSDDAAAAERSSAPAQPDDASTTEPRLPAVKDPSENRSE